MYIFSLHIARFICRNQQRPILTLIQIALRVGQLVGKQQLPYRRPTHDLQNQRKLAHLTACSQAFLSTLTNFRRGENVVCVVFFYSPGVCLSWQTLAIIIYIPVSRTTELRQNQPRYKSVAILEIVIGCNCFLYAKRVERTKFYYMNRQNIMYNCMGTHYLYRLVFIYIYFVKYATNSKATKRICRFVEGCHTNKITLWISLQITRASTIHFESIFNRYELV